MEHLLGAIERAITDRNYYAALATALALPDICGWAEEPTLGSKARYVSWFDRFLESAYRIRVGPSREPTQFLTGSDCYALRCAFLHEGRDDITDQKAQEVVDGFEFTVAPPGVVVHCNRSNAKLQLQVDLFCADVVAAVRAWARAVEDLPAVQHRLTMLLRLHDVNGNVLA